MNKKAFVTGGTGFIGTNLIKLLADRGWEIHALYRKSATREHLNCLPVNWIKGSVTDRESITNSIPENTSAIFHLAGDTNLWSNRNPQQTAVNVMGTENMVFAAVKSGADTFVHTSSVAAWGEISGIVTEDRYQRGAESWINYEHTKWQGERRALNGTNHGLRVIILNPANVVGPHDKNNWGRLFTALQDDKLPFIADGCVSVANVKNIAEAHLTAATQGRSGERYILGGDHHQFSDFVQCINKKSGANNMPKIIPTALFRSYARLASGLSSLAQKEPSITPELAHLMTRKRVRYNSDKAKEQLGYTIPPMHQSVDDCYQWLKNEQII